MSAHANPHSLHQFGIELAVRLLLRNHFILVLGSVEAGDHLFQSFLMVISIGVPIDDLVRAPWCR